MSAMDVSIACAGIVDISGVNVTVFCTGMEDISGWILAATGQYRCSRLH